jgi:acyl carrier protein
MTRSELEKTVLEIVRDQKTLPENIDPTASLRDAGIDSLDSLSILFALEERFKISIPDELARSITSLADMVNVIEQLTLPANG